MLTYVRKSKNNQPNPTLPLPWICGPRVSKEIGLQWEGQWGKNVYWILSLQQYNRKIAIVFPVSWRSWERISLLYSEKSMWKWIYVFSSEGLQISILIFNYVDVLLLLKDIYET